MSLDAHPTSVRNVAIVAHVDHGKTTLVDAMLRQTGTFRANQEVADRVMDSMDQERERGITILAKAASVTWYGCRINLVDTPGHADFGGEVERALTLVDGVLLLVDAAEGPLPQTRYVLQKALARKLPTVVVINKVDRSDAQPDVVLDQVYELFFDLGADEGDIEFPIIATIAREGRAMAGIGIPAENADLGPLFQAIVDTVPAPAGDPDGPVQALVSNLDASDYLGRLAIGRVVRGRLRKGQNIALLDEETSEGAAPVSRRLTSLMAFTGVGREDVEEAVAGDLFVIAGFPEVEVGDTLADPAHPEPLPRLEVDEPVIRMTFGVNTSPMAGRDGKYLTSRHLRERLDREVLGNVSIKLAETDSPDVIEVAGRGELQLAVLIESMRREGYELQVSRPEVVVREIDGVRSEPLERGVVDVPEEHVGTITQALAPRKGKVTDLQPGDPGRTVITFEAPARGLIGFRSLLLTATRGTALLHTHHAGWLPWAGELPHRQGGAMIAD
ncbi:MAG: GTP-binding protein, partial [Acidimicrobiales bacterium]